MIAVGNPLVKGQVITCRQIGLAVCAEHIPYSNHPEQLVIQVVFEWLNSLNNYLILRLGVNYYIFFYNIF